ncbi:hypothetical protein PsW64_04804 [Pseudovibrio sp. W64]|nr:hypothetical protein PsW64_04804 [Pseudovibrio sp. W64]
MLNEYQRQFVACLTDFEVEYLVIGGMALKHHIERDLLVIWIYGHH